MYGLNGQKLGQVLAGSGPLGPYIVNPPAVPKGNNEGDHQALMDIRERHYAIEHRVADVEARASTVTRELRWFQSDRENIRKLVGMTHTHSSEILELGEKLNGTMGQVGRASKELEDAKSSIFQRIESLERGHDAGAMAKGREGHNNAAEQWSQSLKKIEAAQGVRNQTVDARVKLVEERVTKAEASAEGAKKASEELSRKHQALHDRLGKAEGEGGGMTKGSMSVLREVGTSTEADRGRGAEVSASLLTIERAVDGVREAVGEMRTNHEERLEASTRNVQAHCGEITRRLDRIESDVRHVKNALDLNTMSLDNLLRTVLCGIREEALSTRQVMQSQLSMIHRDVNTQLGALRKPPLVPMAYNGGRPSEVGFSVGAVEQYAGETRISGSSRPQGSNGTAEVHQQQGDNEMAGGYAPHGGIGDGGVAAGPFIWGAPSAHNHTPFNSIPTGEVPVLHSPQGSGAFPSMSSTLQDYQLPPPSRSLMEEFNAPLRDEEIAEALRMSSSSAYQSISAFGRPNRAAALYHRPSQNGQPERGGYPAHPESAKVEGEGEGGNPGWEHMPPSPNQSTAVNVDHLSRFRQAALSHVGPLVTSPLSRSSNLGPEGTISSALTSLPPTPTPASAATSNPDNL